MTGFGWLGIVGVRSQSCWKRTPFLTRERGREEEGDRERDKERERERWHAVA